MLVRDVVRQLELVKGDHFLHPLFAGVGAVRVDVHSFRHLRIRFAGNYPSPKNSLTFPLSKRNNKLNHLPVVKFVSVVVSRHDVQEKNVFGVRIEAREAKFHLREDLPAWKKSRIVSPQ